MATSTLLLMFGIHPWTKVPSGHDRVTWVLWPLLQSVSEVIRWCLCWRNIGSDLLALLVSVGPDQATVSGWLGSLWVKKEPIFGNDSWHSSSPQSQTSISQCKASQWQGGVRYSRCCGSSQDSKKANRTTLGLVTPKCSTLVPIFKATHSRWTRTKLEELALNLHRWGNRWHL